jgi:hypothetical protein
MNGKTTAGLLEKWDLGEHLSDDEMQHLADGLGEVRDFCLHTKLVPLGNFYSIELVSINAAIETRNDVRREKKRERKVMSELNT